MENKLTNIKVAVLVADGFEESEFTVPIKALKKEGALVDVISIKKGTVRSWSDKNWSNEYAIDNSIDDVREISYDALLLPGGVMNPDQLRSNEKAVEFVTDFLKAGKPVAAICHGPWTLIETRLLKGRTLTSYHSIKTDLQNAGVNWVDREVVVDEHLVTSRKPDDLPAFCEKMIQEFAKPSAQSHAVMVTITGSSYGAYNL